MAVGQVSFHDDREVKKVLVRQRENPIVNRLNKTKVEKHPDLKKEKDDRLRDLRKKDQAVQQERVCARPFSTFLFFLVPFPFSPCHLLFIAFKPSKSMC